MNPGITMKNRTVAESGFGQLDEVVNMFRRHIGQELDPNVSKLVLITARMLPSICDFATR